MREVVKHVSDYYVEGLNRTLILVDYFDVVTGDPLAFEISGYYYGRPEPEQQKRLDNLKEYDGRSLTMFEDVDLDIVETIYDECK